MARGDKYVEKGPGLARGPALIVGSILLTFALLALIKHNAFPAFSANFPDGDATGTKFLGFEVNGWTNWLAAVAGGLLLFGAAQHLLAKLMSAIVGLALAAAAIIALASGDILGLGAANIVTVIGLGAAAVVLLLNVFAPRIKHEREDDTVATDTRREGRFARDHASSEDERPGAVAAGTRRNSRD
jgi:hypothetical protein